MPIAARTGTELMERTAAQRPTPRIGGSPLAAFLLLVAALLLITAPPLTAQRYLVRVYTEQDGLLNSGVTDLDQDASGRMWFLTKAGVTTYDGTAWQELPMLQGASVRNLFRFELDGRGEAWAVGREPNALFHFNGQIWESLPFPEDVKKSDAWVTSLAVVEMAEGPWVAVGTHGSGLYLWDRQRWRRLTVADGLDDPNVQTVVAAEAGRLYVGTDGGLSLVTESLEVRSLASTIHDAPSRSIWGMFFERQSRAEGRLWLVGDSWIGYLQGQRFILLEKSLAVPVYRPRNQLNVQADGRGGIYFGNPATTFHLDAEGRLERFGKWNGLVTDGATAFHLDREQNLWVSSLRGVSKVTSLRFATYDREHGLLSDEVTAILELASGDLVFGHRAGLTVLEGNAFRPLPLVRDALSSDQLGRRVLDLDQDARGYLWVAFSNQGLARLDAAGKARWSLGGAGTNRVDTVRVDHQDRVWIGTRGGLFEADPETLELERDESLGDLRIRRILLGRDNTLYLVTSADGLYAGREGQWQHFVSTEGGAANSLFAACETEDTVWIGSDAGLLVLEDGELRRPTEPALRIERPVYFVVEDHQGRLWIGTDFGVFSWDGEQLRQFTVREGLAGNSTNRAAGWVDRRGALWIGSDRGVSRFQEVFDDQSPMAPRIDLLELEVGGETRALGDDVVELRHSRNQIIFHARAITFIDEAHVEFRSRLEGVDEDWIYKDSSTRFESRYSSIDHGFYRFRIQARHRDGVWSDEAVAELMIAQPFWRRGWFYLLLSLGLAVVVYSVQHYRAQQRYSRRLEDEVRARTAALAASEQAIAGERERLYVTLSSIADGVIATDREGKVSLLNQAAQRMTGWSHAEASGRHLDEILPLCEEGIDEERPLQPIAKVFAADQPLSFPGRYRFSNRQGSSLILELTGAPVRSGPSGSAPGEQSGVVVAFRDVSERVRIEEERSKTQKLEALGVLAGGIAHDFNNMLTGIVGNLSLARMNDLDEAGGSTYLDKAERAVERASALARQLLTFARGGAPLTSPASMAELVHEAAAFVLSGSNVRCATELADDLWPVEVDQGQISQVLSNLLINADQAMPSGGVIEIRAQNLTLVEATPLLPAGRYVHLAVEDHGAGIAPRHLRQVFDPYFTTKPTGSGLGLATVYSIVKKHGGAITVESDLGVGTTFDLYVPVSERQPEIAAEPQLLEPSVPARILLMDDEESVREVLANILAVLGYRAALAGEGRHAVELYREAHAANDPFDLVILDLTVPGGMGGMETLQLLRSFDPQVNAVVSSGYSKDPILARYREHGLRGVLTKPYRLSDVARILREALVDSLSGVVT